MARPAQHTGQAPGLSLVPPDENRRRDRRPGHGHPPAGLLARGDASVFLRMPPASYKEKIWDHAAGSIIVAEAGGLVTDGAGKPLDFGEGRFLESLDRGIIAAASKQLHAALVQARTAAL